MEFDSLLSMKARFNFESGERRLDILELRRMCDVMGITLVEFAIRLEQAMLSSTH